MAFHHQTTEELMAAIGAMCAPRPKVRQSTPAEMAAARAAVQAVRDEQKAPIVARLAAAPVDMTALTDDQLTLLIYDAISLYPRDAGYALGEEVSRRAHAERARRAAPAFAIAAE
jgi:hypothetical protein